MLQANKQSTPLAVNSYDCGALRDHGHAKRATPPVCIPNEPSCIVESPPHSAPGVHSVSRRAFVINMMVPAATIVTAVPSASMADSDQKLFALMVALEEAEKKAVPLGHAFNNVEEYMFAWKRRNPEPPRRSYDINDNGDVCLRQDGKLYVLVRSVKDLQAEEAEYERESSIWAERKNAEKEQCGFKKVATEWEAATQEIGRICGEIADTPATTMEGLIAKARACVRHDFNSAPSIVDDLIAIGDSTTSI